MDEKLDLSDAQEEQIRAVWTEQHETAKAWREANPDATREERQAYREEQRSETNAAIEALLTPEQTEPYQNLNDEWTERRGDRLDDRGDRGSRRGQRHDEQRGDRTSGLVERLDLTEAQQAQLKEIRTTYREAAQAWREAHPDATREENQAYRAEQRGAMKEALETVLTPEQVAQLERLKAARGERFRKRRGQENDSTAQRSEDEDAAPAESTFGLENYPNPFNPSTEIQFTLPEASRVTLAVYDVQGREVARLLDGQQEAGPHAVTFTAADLPTGTYIYRLTAGAVTESGRMVLMK